MQALKYNPTQTQALETEFERAMDEQGLACDSIVIDAGIQRFKVDGDKNGSKNGWYIAYGGEHPTIVFGSWKTGETFTWSPVTSKTLSPEDTRRRTAQINEAKAEAECQRKQQQGIAAKVSQAIWENAEPAQENHPYLVKKQVKPHGIRCTVSGNLLIPLYDAGGDIVTTQEIDEDGQKRFRSKGKVAGNYFYIGELTNTIYIVEGFATGATIHEVMRAFTVVAFNTGNLLPVGLRVRKEYPDATIIFCADNDAKTPGNPGLTKARKAAQAIQASVAKPTFALPDTGTDFNDLLIVEGRDVALACLMQVETFATTTGDPSRKLTLISADTIKTESTTWVYEGRIPENDITIICGDPDVGKSMITHDIAARLTRGQLEGVFKGQPVNVLLASAEDSPSHTIVPQFTAAGGDPTKLHIIKIEVYGYDGGGFKLPGDLRLLVDKAKAVDAKILIIDPLMSHLESELNANNDQHIRQALGVLPEFAASNDMTFIIVCHLNKNEAGNVKYRIGGSLGIFAVPRSVLLAGEDPEDEEKRVLVHIKCNVGEKAPALSYSLERKHIEIDGKTIETGGVIWHGEKDGITAESILGHKKDAEAQSLLEEAIAWLNDRLEGGPMNATDSLAAAKKMGFSEGTMRRARRSIGVESKKVGYGKKSSWEWCLPVKGVHKGVHTPNDERLCENIGENGQKPQQNIKGVQAPGCERLSDPVRDQNSNLNDMEIGEIDI